jgi:TnpA family transposase
MKILTGAIKAHRIKPAWDEVVRLVASMSARVVSPSLALLRLGSYARQNRIHQALTEIGRIHKTIHILRTLDDEEYRRRMGRELNKGEASHELSRFLCFGKEGAGVRRSAAHLQLPVSVAQRGGGLEHGAHRARRRAATSRGPALRR